jgi:hypothetical protein
LAARLQLAAEKFSDQLRDLVAVRLQSKVSCIKEMDFRVRNVAVAMLAMSSVFFLLLGLLAELAVKAGGARSRPLMGGGEEAA